MSNPTTTIITLSKTPELWARLDLALAPQVDVLASLGIEIERILVNNTRDLDFTAAALRSGWMVVEPGYNTSYSIGHNMAVRASAGSRLLLLNDDLIPRPDFLYQMLQPGAEVVGALLLNNDGTVNHAGTMMAPDGRTDHIGRGSPAEDWQGCCHGGYCMAPAATFAAVRISKALWDTVGGLDEQYYYGWEDTDFCIRAMQAKARIQINHRAVATHNECGTRPRGGMHYTTNYNLFTKRWTAALPGILADYKDRAGSSKLLGMY